MAFCFSPMRVSVQPLTRFFSKGQEIRIDAKQKRAIHAVALFD